MTDTMDWLGWLDDLANLIWGPEEDVDLGDLHYPVQIEEASSTSCCSVAHAAVVECNI